MKGISKGRKGRGREGKGKGREGRGYLLRRHVAADA